MIGIQAVVNSRQKTGGTSLEKYIAEAGIDKDLTFYAQWKELKADDINADNTSNIPSDKNENNLSGLENPPTGDNIVIWLSLLIISAVGLIFIKNKDNKNN